MLINKQLLVYCCVVIVLLPGHLLASENAPSWADSVTLSGDFRLRYESIEQDERDDRSRARYRGRLGLSAKVADDIKVLLRLATGGDDPVSTNQTFGDGFSTKDIGVDLLYVDWTINEQWSLVAGKTKQAWYKAGGTSLAWDGDLNPEGAAVKFSQGAWFASAGGFSVEERSSDSNTILYYAQAGTKLNVSRDNALTLGSGFFTYDNTVGVEPFFRAQARGNSVDTNGNYQFDYELIEVFAAYDTEVAGWPVTVFGDWYQNTAVDDADTAFAVGIKLGKAKKKGSKQISWTYHDTEADALVGTFTDSDFAGGNTNSSGQFLKGKYALRDNVVVGFTLILSEFGGVSGSDTDYDRFMLDFEFKF